MTLLTKGFATSNGIYYFELADDSVSKDFELTLAVENWAGEVAPFTQEVTVSGITADDRPVVGVVYSDNFEMAEQQRDAWALVYRIKTDTDKITAYATDKAETEIPIQLMCVRK